MITKFEYKGSWKLPQSEAWVDGTLNYDPDIGARLEIFGTFNRGLFDRSSKEIILGKTTSGDVTLIDNWYLSTKNIQNGVTIGIYQPIIIIEGQHFETISEICFSKVIFRLFNFFQWIDKSGIKYEVDPKGNEYSITYKKVEDIYFTISEECEGKISFESPRNSEDFYNKIELEEQSYITLTYNKSKNYKEILNDIIYFLGFTTLCTFEQSYPINITFNDDKFVEKIANSTRIKNIKCIYQNNSYDAKYKLRNKNEHLIRYNDIKNIFPNVIKNWFELYRKLEPVFILMLYSFRHKNKFSVDKFMDIVRALESYHRNTHNNQRIQEEEYSLKVKEILAMVTLEKAELEWLESRLKYGNEPNLNFRLKELVKEHQNAYVKEHITDTKKFGINVVDSRNYYTHYDRSLEDKALKGKELFIITQKLMGILYSCILRQIGLENAHFENGLQNHLYE